MGNFVLSLKEWSSQNVPPFFFRELQSTHHNWTIKKNASKNINFWRSYGLLICQLISNASKIFPRCMTSLKPNVRNSVYISMLFRYICFKSIHISFPVRKVEILFLNQNWPLSSKKWVRWPENVNVGCYDVIMTSSWTKFG